MSDAESSEEPSGPMQNTNSQHMQRNDETVEEPIRREELEDGSTDQEYHHKSEVEGYRRQVASLQDEKRALKERIANQEDQHKSDVEDYEQEIATLKSEKRELEEEIAGQEHQHKSDVEGYKRKITSLRIEKRELEKDAHRVARLDREKHARHTAELERERDQHVKQLASAVTATDEMAQTVASIQAELEDERRARQTAELERDGRKKQLAIFEAVTSEMMAKTATTIEVERAAMRKALTNMIYEQKKQAETISRKEVEEREKIVIELKLEGERRINAILREIAAEREKMSAIRKHE